MLMADGWFAVQQAVNLTIRTFNNQVRRGPVVIFKIDAVRNSARLEFYSSGWQPDKVATVKVNVNLKSRKGIDTLLEAEELVENYIKGWEAKHGRS